MTPKPRTQTNLLDVGAVVLGLALGLAQVARSTARKPLSPAGTTDSIQRRSKMEEAQKPRPKRGGAFKVGLSLLTVALAAGAIIGTYAAFSSTTSNSDNSFAAGTVTLSDNDANSAMLALTAGKPGDSDTSCIRVSYTGSLPASVRLYGTTTGTGLDAYLNVTVTRGTISGTPTFDSCTGFSADSTDYLGSGNGVIYSGTLQAFADNYTAGIVDPTSGSAESWTTNETHDYKIVVSLADNNDAQGLNANQTFTWEARNN